MSDVIAKHCCFRRVPDSRYEVHKFEDRNNHNFALPSDKQYLRTRRLTFDADKFMVECGNVGIGASKAFNVMKQIAGGYSNAGFTKTECKNFNGDELAFLGDCCSNDSTPFHPKKKLDDGFFFDHFINNDGL